MNSVQEYPLAFDLAGQPVLTGGVGVAPITAIHLAGSQIVEVGKQWLGHELSVITMHGDWKSFGLYATREVEPGVTSIRKIADIAGSKVSMVIYDG